MCVWCIACHSLWFVHCILELFRQFWYFLLFILSLAWHVKCIIALCTVAFTYQSIYINQNISIVIVNTNRNTTDLFSVNCIVEHFRPLILFSFGHCVVYLSSKNVWRHQRGNKRLWMKGIDLGSTTQKTTDCTASDSPFGIFTFYLYILK